MKRRRWIVLLAAILAAGLLGFAVYGVSMMRDPFRTGFHQPLAGEGFEVRDITRIFERESTLELSEHERVYEVSGETVIVMAGEAKEWNSELEQQLIHF